MGVYNGQIMHTKKCDKNILIIKAKAICQCFIYLRDKIQYIYIYKKYILILQAKAQSHGMTFNGFWKP